MKSRLGELNDWIDKKVRWWSKSAQNRDIKARFQGMIIPFGQRDIEDPLVILRCIPDLSIIFETKVRAPFKVVFEVCKLSEITLLVEAKLQL